MRTSQLARRLSLVIGLCLMVGTVTASRTSHAEFNVGFGLNYNSGGYGGGVIPYYGNNVGAVASLCTAYIPPPTMNACNACAASQPGFFPGGPGQYGPGPSGPGYGPGPFGPGGGGLGPMPSARLAMPPPPPPAPFLPPHLAMPAQPWGQGFNRYPGPLYPGINTGSSCVPCSIGMQPQVVMPVPGGPSLYNMSRFSSGLSNDSMFYARSRNAWEIDDTASIVWGTAFGLSNLTSNVYPVAYPRNEPTLIAPNWFSTGDRDSMLDPRPHVGP